MVTHQNIDLSVDKKTTRMFRRRARRIGVGLLAGACVLAAICFSGLLGNELPGYLLGHALLPLFSTPPWRFICRMSGVGTSRRSVE